ncbi:diacylglycerol kinase [Paenibacillus sp. 3LSP]|uniref:diacylglycerol kinase family protein n=1 Tax=Paenibacillus sp. 3LSP TaxID=2800795 RepID=UPI0028FD3A1E|nr:diacylglycerol kinase [Paenibacillus sp. 3LSP]MDU0331879.1 diacylglycerol kinase [Paenibacillus sp. 3LSP]
MKPSHRWSSSFRYAWEGIATSFRTQRHVRFHCVAAVIVIAAAIALSLPARDVALLLLVIALVISLELVNTAIEAVVDLAAPEWHRLGKIAKDAAAGAVLVAAVVAVVIGILIFYQPLMRWLGLL